MILRQRILRWSASQACCLHAKGDYLAQVINARFTSVDNQCGRSVAVLQGPFINLSLKVLQAGVL